MKVSLGYAFIVQYGRIYGCYIHELIKVAFVVKNISPTNDFVVNIQVVHYTISVELVEFHNCFLDVLGLKNLGRKRFTLRNSQEREKWRPDHLQLPVERALDVTAVDDCAADLRGETLEIFVSLMEILL